MPPISARNINSGANGTAKHITAMNKNFWILLKSFHIILTSLYLSPHLEVKICLLNLATKEQKAN
jgi:hypothetical protein